MSSGDWLRVIDQAGAMAVQRVQFVGGEPTLHPDLEFLVRHALKRGLEVEVYTNLVRVTEAHWRLFQSAGVRLATSYYSPYASEHNAITRRPSHDRTLANIGEAVQRSVPIRVGVIQVRETQAVDAAMAELRALGVANVGTDHLRQIGRGVRDRSTGPDQLCGRCAEAKLGVLPTGEVVPCLLARWVVVGDLRCSTLEEIYVRSAPVRERLVAATRSSGAADKCAPDDGGICEQPTCKPHWG